MHQISTLPPPLLEHWDWQLHAACRGMDVTVFFQPDRSRGPAKRSHEAQAKAVCARCPVQRDCLDWALDTGEPFGVWGGMSPADRHNLTPRHAA